MSFSTWVASKKLCRDIELEPLEEAEYEVIADMALVGCSDTAIGWALNFRRKDWLAVKEADPRIQDTIARANSRGEHAILATQFKLAINGNIEMLKWLGRARLGQNRESEGIKQLNQVNVVMDSPEIREHLKELYDFIYRPEPEPKPKSAIEVESSIVAEQPAHALPPSNDNGNGNGQNNLHSLN